MGGDPNAMSIQALPLDTSWNVDANQNLVNLTDAESNLANAIPSFTPNNVIGVQGGGVPNAQLDNLLATGDAAGGVFSGLDAFGPNSIWQTAGQLASAASGLAGGNGNVATIQRTVTAPAPIGVSTGGSSWLLLALVAVAGYVLLKKRRK